MLLGKDGEVVAVLGLDRLRFECSDRELTLGATSNFYTLEAGAGGYLFMYWLRKYGGGLVFGASADMERILLKQNWTRIRAKGYYLNPPYEVWPNDAWWRVLAKGVLRYAHRTQVSRQLARIPPDSIAKISVSEEHDFVGDWLPRRSPFGFRFAPPLDYLRWRYKPGLSFVHYRLFRVVARGCTMGYVVINDSEKQIMVAQCDAEDPQTLAYGVLLSILEVTRYDRKPRTVFLISTHHEMQKIYEQIGFRGVEMGGRLWVGSLGGPLDLPADTSNWLLNYDWGDNGMVAPFPDQLPAQV